MAVLRVLAGAVLTALLAVPAAAQHVTEHDVKAAFLYNFTRFVEWPAGSPPDSQPFRLCVVADPPATAAIERTMRDESVNGRAAEVLVPASAQQARSCQILYIGQSQIGRAAPLVAAVRDEPVLVVGDAPGFLARGGAIEFLLDGGRVRFDINIDTARRARLTVSSRLLQVARRIEGKPR